MLLILQNFRFEKPCDRKKKTKKNLIKEQRSLKNQIANYISGKKLSPFAVTRRCIQTQKY